MQAFKVENYERLYGTGTFVPFRHLTDAEALAIRAKLIESLKLPREIAPRDIALAVYAKSIPIDHYNAENNAFNLPALMEHLELELPESVYLNWHHYDDIDEIKTADFVAVFDEIWYPATDDLDVIDSKDAVDPVDKPFWRI